MVLKEQITLECDIFPRMNRVRKWFNNRRVSLIAAAFE